MKRTSPPPKTIKLNVLLDAHTDQMLDELCNVTGQTKATIVRSALVSRYQHDIARHPTCSNGQRCFVPQMFANPQYVPPPAPPVMPHAAPQDPDAYLAGAPPGYVMPPPYYPQRG